MDKVLKDRRQNTEDRMQETEYNTVRPIRENYMPKETAKRFTDLIVWQKAHQFVLGTYRLSTNFPQTEIYGLTSQIRRAAVSIPANIAEGFKKKSKADKLRYMNISQGSLEECRYYLILVKDLGYANTEQLQIQLDEISKLLAGYAKAINK